jgi:ASC-1-like (ASCH) protein
MDHVAIMKKSWGLTEKILDGRKKIESRWYMSKCRPWNGIISGDRVYFKNSGEPVRLRTEVSRILQFDNLTPGRVRSLLGKYGEADGLEAKDTADFFHKFRNKKYCILVFLKNPRRIPKFDIDKKGFGAMSAWITVPKISAIIKR